jgi:hypothetical protein
VEWISYLVAELKQVSDQLSDLVDEFHCAEYEAGELKEKLDDRAQVLEDRAG